MRHHKLGFTIVSLLTASSLLFACSSAPKKADTSVTRVTLDRPSLGTSEEIKSEPLLPRKPHNPVVVQPSAPKDYVVRKGDTLWDISKRFLKTPWSWPEIWHVNPEIKNPHLIYPGDRISLYYVNGEPRLAVNRKVLGDAKLSPHIREQSLKDRDTGIPIQSIRPFLIKPEVLAQETLQEAPHIIASRDEHLIYGENTQVYVRDLQDDSLGSRYSVFRTGETFINPDTREILGYEAIHTSDAEVIRRGNPATVTLVNTVREVLRGDRLLPEKSEPDNYYFLPHSPPDNTRGQILSVFDSVNQIAGYQIAALSLGKRDGLEKGHVLAVNQRSRLIKDHYHSDKQKPEVLLPEERSGLIMVFKTFEKVSYGLIMEATRPIRVHDTVTTP